MIWINLILHLLIQWYLDKRNIGNNINIIKSKSLEGDRLINVSIYKFDKNYALYSRLEASEARISEIHGFYKMAEN